MVANTPKVTVLMAVYNGENYLRDAIDSILNQTFQDFEFLILNDGSTDNTQAIIQSYNNSRIRLVNNEQNLGLSRSLNKGLELAQGKFIARQDADDISEPERLAKQVAFLEMWPEIALVGSWYKEIDAQGKLIKKGDLPCDYTQIRWHLFFYCPFVHSAVMLRKLTVLEQVGFYNETLSYSMDYELWLRTAQRFPVANLDEYLVRLRVNPHSMTETYGERRFEGFNIRVGTVTRLLDGDTTNIAFNEMRFKRMALLLFDLDSDVNLKPEIISQVLGEILRLHAAFCQYFNINERDSQFHRAELQNHLSNRLVELAHSQIHQYGHDIRLLLIQAFRLRWKVLLTTSYLRLLLKLLIDVRLLTKTGVAHKKLT